jgi:hypothetical protein
VPHEPAADYFAQARNERYARDSFSSRFGESEFSASVAVERLWRCCRWGKEKSTMTMCSNESVLQPKASVYILPLAGRLLRKFWLRSLVISVVLLTPCLWHAHIEAGDLASHVYNAWLTHLIKTGQTPGLWLARRWNNILFDYMLVGLGNIVGWGATEKIAAGLAVLIFFWGAFLLVGAMTQRVPWPSVPCLAMAAYGWMFENGFMNCYMSVGLAFAGLAILIQAKGCERGWVALLIPLIWLAHPFGMALLIGGGTYVVVREQLGPVGRNFAFVAVGLLLLGIHLVFRYRYPLNVTWSYDMGGSWSHAPTVFHDGIDQLVTYGPHYFLPARSFRILAWCCILIDVLRRRHEPQWWTRYLIPAELYALTVLATLLMPTAIDGGSLHHMGFISIGFVTERLTSVSIVFIICLLGVVRPQRWNAAGFGIISIIFFFFLFRDTSTINKMEDEVRRCVLTLAPNQRVVGAIRNLSGSRITIHHILARACMGHCFDYDNYEAGTPQFRVRAFGQNPFVMANGEDAYHSAIGRYIVRPADLPLVEVEQCSSNLTPMCIRELVAGETNGHVQVQTSPAAESHH